MTQTAQDIIEELGMQPHPEGGWYVEMFRDSASSNGRSHSTAIYYLLEIGQISHWHRVDAVEIWHWYGGAPLELSVSEDGHGVERIRLGNEVTQGERPQGIVPRSAWQSARSTGEWTLIGCTVAPGFEFSGFEMAAEGWEPG